MGKSNAVKAVEESGKIEMVGDCGAIETVGETGAIETVRVVQFKNWGEWWN